MSHEHQDVLRAYVLSTGSPDDRGLRMAIDEGCPDCAAELAQAEAELATLALALPPQAPRPELRARVLQRIAAEQALAAKPAAPVSSQPAAAERHPLPNTASRPTRSRAVPALFAACLLFAAVALFTGVQWQSTSNALAHAGLAISEAQVATARAELANTQLALAKVQGDAARIEAQIAAVHAEASAATATASAAEAARQARDLNQQLQAALGDQKAAIAAQKAAESAQTSASSELAKLQAQLDLVHAADLAVVPLAGATAQPGAAGRLLHDRTNHRWLVSLRNLAPPPAGRCYELWFITADGQKIPSETFQPDQGGKAELMVPVPAGLTVTVAAVTDEPLGGVTAPTGQIQLVGKLD